MTLHHATTTPKLRFAAAVGEEPKIEVGLVLVLLACGTYRAAWVGLYRVRPLRG